MRNDGFIRVAAATPRVIVGDTAHNAAEVIRLLAEAEARGAKAVAFPELCLTGYTAGDLFLQRTLRDGALRALEQVVGATGALDLLAVVGLPLSVDGRLYNCAAVLHRGRILGVVPKRNPPNYGEFYELRHFAPGQGEVRDIEILGQSVPFGGDLLFECAGMAAFSVAVEVCEDLWVPDSPGVGHARAGATLILNPSASDELAGKAEYRRMLIKSQSARLVCAYVYSDAGEGESSTDLVFAGHDLIAENGHILNESERYTTGLICAEPDFEYLAAERLRMNTFGARLSTHRKVSFSVDLNETRPERAIDPYPFVPGDEAERARRLEEILDIQVAGLAARLKHTGIRTAVLGISGGLDSTLALLVTVRAFDRLSIDRGGILAVTMPGFGTTGRTKSNAVDLVGALGAELREISIHSSVERHFLDIGQDPNHHDVTYENSQARERTQILMDLANQRNGLVVGTGDLSELALGWATYNGDHMSMYGVNASIPKTLVRHLVRFCAERAEGEALRSVLLDILDTPVSPELLPPIDGEIAQKTEDLVGPYALHDFFLYHMLRRMSGPNKILRLAKRAFEGTYSEEVILKWLKVFIRRFFAQQFKRSCMPDGPKVGSVALSPRGDLRMPSDASARLWLDQLQ